MTKLNNDNERRKFPKQIYDEIIELELSKNSWNEFKDIVNNSEHFKKFGSSFLHWVVNNYVYRMIIQIAKITDKKNKKDDISFIEYLECKINLIDDETAKKDKKVIEDINVKYRTLRNKEFAHLTSTQVEAPLYGILHKDVETLKTTIEKYFIEETKEGVLLPEVKFKELFNKAWIEEV